MHIEGKKHADKKTILCNFKINIHTVGVSRPVNAATVHVSCGEVFSKMLIKNIERCRSVLPQPI